MITCLAPRRRRTSTYTRALLETLEPRALFAASPMSQVAGANNEFAVDLFKQLKVEPGNVFFSPYSIESALAMVLDGARGKTAQEMAGVLHLPGQSVTEEGMQALYQLLQASYATDGYELGVANRLWGKQEYTFNPAYLELTQRIFGAALQTVDFSKPSEAAATINGWIAQQTHDRIKDLVPVTAINNLTRMILTNAIYFKGDWQSPFMHNDTRDMTFYNSTGSINDVPVMYQRNGYSYYQQAGNNPFQAINIDYQGGDVEMLVILPPKGGLDNLEANLTADMINSIESHMVDTTVDLFLPKFEMTAEYSLGDVLQGMGMKAVFSDASDLSGMLPAGAKEKLQITQVLHKSFIRVDEKGSEAAAATAVIVGAVPGCYNPTIPPPPPQFLADHSFIYAIREKSTGAILFMGRMTDPPPDIGGEYHHGDGSILVISGPGGGPSPIVTQPIDVIRLPLQFHSLMYARFVRGALSVTITPPTVPVNDPAPPVTPPSTWIRPHLPINPHVLVAVLGWFGVV